MAYVKCLYCGERFNWEKEPHIKIGRRYAHEKCAQAQDQKKIQEDKDLVALEDYISQTLKEKGNWPIIKKQVQEYHTKLGYTYSGMLKTLKWFYDIKGNSIDEGHGGVGIIPYAYKDATEYYYALHLAKLSNEKKGNISVPSREIVIESPRVYVKPPRLFWED